MNFISVISASIPAAAITGCATPSTQSHKDYLGENPARITLDRNASLSIAGKLKCSSTLGITTNSRPKSLLIRERTNFKGKQVVESDPVRSVRIPASESRIFVIDQTNNVGASSKYFELPIDGGADYLFHIEPKIGGLIYDTLVGFDYQIYKNGEPISVKQVPLPNKDTCED